VVEKSQFFWGGKRRRRLLGDGGKNLILLGAKKGKKLWLKNPNSFLGEKTKGGNFRG
jgi:hypothetical protein